MLDQCEYSLYTLSVVDKVSIFSGYSSRPENKKKGNVLPTVVNPGLPSEVYRLKCFEKGIEGELRSVEDCRSLSFDVWTESCPGGLCVCVEVGSFVWRMRVTLHPSLRYKVEWIITLPFTKDYRR